MIERTYDFSVSTHARFSNVNEDVTLEFEEHLTEAEIEAQVQNEFEQWVWANIDAGFSRK